MRRLLAVLVVSLLLLAACGSDDDGGDTDDTSSGDLPAGATVTDISTDLGTAPTFDVEGTDEAPTEVLVEDVVEGDGAEVVEGATVEVQYVGTLTDGEEFDSSWERGEPVEFPLGGVIPGWAEGMVGMKVGGRRLVVIPSDLGYGAQGSPPVIPADATLVFVVDLLATTDPPPPPPAGASVTNVSTDLAVAPTFDIEGTDEAPTELVVEDVVEGDGAEATAASTLEVQYVGTLTDGEEFDSSWARGEPASFTLSQVIPGWSEGLVGMKVGGRRLLVIPADLGYGAQGAPPDIPPDATLIFVVDLLGVS